MGEIAPVAGATGGTAARIGGSAGGFAAGRGPPGERAPPPAEPSRAAAVAVARQGLLLDALVWRPAASGAAPAAPGALAGPVRIVPLPPAAGAAGDGAAPAAASAGPWLAGERLATVRGPVGPEALLAESDGLLVLLRGARLHLPAGARLLLAWDSGPVAVDRPADPPRAGAAGGTPAAPPAGAGLPAEAAGAALPAEPAAARAPPAAAGERPEAGPARPPPAAAAPLGEAAGRLAALLGLAVAEEPRARIDPEADGRPGDGSDPAAASESGRSVLLLDLPELGRVRLDLAWSARRVELRLEGLGALPGAERAALLRAFEAALEAAGARGRALLLAAAPEGRPGRPGAAP